MNNRPKLWSLKDEEDGPGLGFGPLHQIEFTTPREVDWVNDFVRPAIAFDRRSHTLVCPDDEDDDDGEVHTIATRIGLDAPFVFTSLKTDEAGPQHRPSGYFVWVAPGWFFSRFDVEPYLLPTALSNSRIELFIEWICKIAWILHVNAGAERVCFITEGDSTYNAVDDGLWFAKPYDLADHADIDCRLYDSALARRVTWPEVQRRAQQFCI